jgi:type I restriction enzyme, S subunit
MEKQMNIPQLRFPEFKGEWEKKKLQEIAVKINSGKTPLGGESVYSETGILFIRSQNINDDKLYLDNSSFISEKINSTMKNSIVFPDDILLNITGASLGRSCVVPNNFTIGNVNQHVCIIRIDKKNNPKFIQPFFSSDKGQNIFTSLQTGSGREGLNFQSIKGLEISLPTLPEQAKIANFLTAIDQKIQTLKKKKNLLENYKKGVMQKLFSQVLRFKPIPNETSGDENVKVFGDWEVKKLGDIAIIKRGAASQHLTYVNKDKGGIRFLRINDFLNNEPVYVKNTDDMKRFTVQTNDLLMAGTGATAGIVFVVPEKFNNLSYSYNAPRIRVENSYFLYVYYYLTSDDILKQQKSFFVGNAQPFLDTNVMRSLKIDLPSIPEQTLIANFLTAIDEKINNTNTQITQMETWKKGLLQKMFV